MTHTSPRSRNAFNGLGVTHRIFGTEVPVAGWTRKKEITAREFDARVLGIRNEQPQKESRHQKKQRDMEQRRRTLKIAAE